MRRLLAINSRLLLLDTGEFENLGEHLILGGWTRSVALVPHEAERL